MSEPKSSLDEPKPIDFIPGNRLSYATTRIEVLCNGNVISIGTGFVLKFGSDYGLITNWHVVTGRHPISKKLLSKQAAIPDCIKFHVTVIWEEDETENRPHSTTMYFKPMEIPLEDEGEVVWTGSEGPGYRNDVVLIPLNDRVEELHDANAMLAHIEGGEVTLKRGVRIDKVDEALASKAISHFYPPVGSDVFILGYPRGVELGGVFPIWKRGSIASEPQSNVTSGGISYNNLLYVDALTKEGMSGAPVVALAKVGEQFVTDDGVMVPIKSTGPKFVGVYAGREGVTQEEYEFSIGRVWKAQTVGELFLTARLNNKR